VGVRALNDLTLEVELEEPVGYFLQILALSASAPVPEHKIQKLGSRWAEPDLIVTNGPFRVAGRITDEVDNGPVIAFEPNPFYHGRFTSNLERVELIALPLTALPDEGAVDPWRLFEEDKVDYLFAPGQIPSHASRARTLPKEFLSSPILQTLYLGLETRRFPFDDRRVRQALAMALDRDELASSIMGGFHTPADGGLLPPGMPGYQPGIALPYDPQRARQLLADAGFPSGRGLPNLEYLSFPYVRGFHPNSDFIRAQLKENLGLEVRHQSVSFKEFVARLQEDPPHLYSWGYTADYPDPDNVLRVFFLEDHVARVGWHHEQFEHLIQQARKIANQEERMAIYRQAEEILVDEVPILPLYYSHGYGMLKPWVTRFPLSPLGITYWKHVVIDPH